MDWRKDCRVVLWNCPGPAFSAAVELNELDRLTENGPVYERQGEAQQQRKEWENSALLSTLYQDVLFVIHTRKG